VRLPVTTKVRYDLLRGGLAEATLRSSAEAPIRLLERNAAIAKLTLSPALDIVLTDVNGRGIDRSVVRVEVYAPGEQLRRHYSGNVTVENGRARYQVPFALNDEPGTWRVRARDVISGLTAEATIRR
jgi:hypothetical protein